MWALQLSWRICPRLWDCATPALLQQQQHGPGSDSASGPAAGDRCGCRCLQLPPPPPWPALGSAGGGGAGVWRGARQRNGCFDRLLLQRQAFASKTAAFAAKSEVTYNVLLPLGGHASPRDGHGGEKRPPVPPGPAACALAGMPPRIRGQAVRARAGVSGASAWHSHACSSIDSARRRRQRRWHYCGRVGAAHADSTALIIFSSWWDGGRVGGVDPAAACCCCRLQRSRHVGVVWPALPLR
jgi:hypothetical protein